MTIEDAKKIAHGLIQGYIGPDHKVNDMRASTALSCRRFKRLTRKAGMIAPKRQPTDEALAPGAAASLFQPSVAGETQSLTME